MRRFRLWLAKRILPKRILPKDYYVYGIYVGRPTYTATSSWLHSTSDGIYTFDGHKYVKVRLKAG